MSADISFENSHNAAGNHYLATHREERGIIYNRETQRDVGGRSLPSSGSAERIPNVKH